MEEILKHTETLNTKQESHTVERSVGIFFGAIEVALAFRLIFKLLGANPDNVFVQALYSFTGLFTGIFEGIFSRATGSGNQTTAIFEPATLIAMIVVGVLAWFVLRLITPRTGNFVERNNYSENNKI